MRTNGCAGAFDCSALLCARSGASRARDVHESSYLRSSADGGVKNFRDWGLPLGRRFRALKLWCLIREQGIAKLQARLRRDLENARWFESGCGRRQTGECSLRFLQTVCVVHEPPGVSGEPTRIRRAGRHTDRSGAAYVTPAILDGRWMVRVSVGGEQTERAHVEALWSHMRRMAEQGQSHVTVTPPAT